MRFQLLIWGVVFAILASAAFEVPAISTEIAQVIPESGQTDQIPADQDTDEAVSELLPIITALTPDQPTITLKGRLSTPERILAILQVEGQQIVCEKHVGQKGILRKVRLANSLLLVRIEDWTDDGISVWTQHFEKNVPAPPENRYEIN